MNVSDDSNNLGNKEGFKKSSRLKDNVKVKYFYSERHKIRMYLMQVKLLHRLNLKKYNNEETKVLIVGNYLRGDA